jgi:ribosomal-protein-alanine N-acetyltransferase
VSIVTHPVNSPLLTPRLSLRPLAPSDAADAFTVYGDERVLLHWTSEPLRREDEARAWCAAQADAHRARGYAQWRVSERDGDFVGCVGLQPLETGEVELVYALRPAMWGLGFAHEAAEAALAYAFGELRLPEVVAIVRPENTASIRVVRAFGMAYTGAGSYFGSSWDRYTIARAAWRARRKEPVVLLRTSRLDLRPVGRDDLDALHDVFGDGEVMRYVGVERRPLAREQLRGSLDRVAVHWRDHGFGPLAVVGRAGGALVGECGLQLLEGGPDVELTYTLARTVWGHGYATEAAGAVLDWGFGDLGLRRIVAVTYPENVASQRVLEKLGMRRTGRRRCYGADLDEFVAGRPGESAGSGRREA